MTSEIGIEKVPKLMDFSRRAMNEESVKTLQTIKQYIEKIGSVKHIILFGSRAQGTYREDSDYDILLITENNLALEEKRKLANRIIADLSRQKIDVDVLFKNMDDVLKVYQKPFSIVKSALETGVLI